MPKRSIQPISTTFGVLRMLKKEDLPKTLFWRNQEEIRKWFKNSAIIEDVQHKQWFALYCEKEDDFTFIIEACGVPVGQIALYGLQTEGRTAEIGRIMIGEPKFAGKGIAKESIEALLRFSREELRLDCVNLEVLDSNERAIALYKKCGFVVTNLTNELVLMTRRLSSDENGFCERAA